jgi:phosphoribosyl-ATP pyrophosphohydrolase
MKRLFEQHYEAIVKRGLITDKTTAYDFLDKIHEEYTEFVIELEESINFKPNNYKQEAIDLICSTMNMLIHFGVDIEQELIKNIKKQKERARNKKNRK